MPNNLILTKCYDAGGALNANSIVKFGAADLQVFQAAAATDKLMGVTTEISTVSGDRVDVVLLGIAEVKLGGTVTRGDRITSDASGNGVAAAPSAGTNNWVVGTALISGVAGDLISVIIGPTTFQG